jgi:hypothetical protein
VANEKHLLLNWGGSYTQSADQPEIWQNGLRLIVVFGDIDTTGTLPSNWDVVPASQVDTDGNWDNTNVFGVDGPGLQTFDPLSYMKDYVQPTLEAYLSTSSFSSTTTLEFLKLSPIGPDGLVIGGRTCLSMANTSLTGAQTGDRLPPQLSLGVSWQTPVIGRRGRGRIFLPSNAASQLTSAGRMSSTPQGAAKDAAVTMLEGLAYQAVGGSGPNVQPIVTGDPWTNYGVITGVRVGDVLDTQRRRRDQLAETYVSGSPSY